VLTLEGITRKFPGVLALDKVDFEIRSNEILGLVGENGAGKSVLTKIMVGLLQPDEGHISLNGERVVLKGAVDAIRKGIGTVFQDGSLIPNLSVAENLFLCHENRFNKLGLLSLRDMIAQARRILKQIDLEIDVRLPVSALSPAAKQMVEIARLLWLSEFYGVKNPILILDEPTTVLADRERNRLFGIMKDIKSRASVVFISHRLQEILENCDRIVVLKDGKKVTEMQTAGADISSIEKLMVGHAFSENRFHEDEQLPPRESVVLKVEGVGKAKCFEPLSFEVHEGEIVSLVGLIGSGKEELCRCISGLEKYDEGKISIDGKVLPNGSSRGAVAGGIGHIPIDRRGEGLALTMTVSDNINYLVLDHLKRAGLISSKLERENAKKWVAECLIKTPTVKTICSSLSGGNQQKIIISKWLSSDVRLLILDHPTRGIDIGAKDEVYRLIRKFSKMGIVMIIMCDTLEEDIGLAHRIIVMRDGRFVEELDASPGKKPSPQDLIKLIV
jgi:ribose transport system ATP-binding protein